MPLVRFPLARSVAVGFIVALLAGVAGAGQPKTVDDRVASQGAWPTDVPGFVAPKGGEHPRLLFRRAELAQIREKAKTAEGQAIVKRLLLAASQKSIQVQLTQGWGSGGFFVEGDGTGSMSSHIALLSAIQAWRVAGGRIFTRRGRTRSG